MNNFFIYFSSLPNSSPTVCGLICPLCFKLSERLSERVSTSQDTSGERRQENCLSHCRKDYKHSERLSEMTYTNIKIPLQGVLKQMSNQPTRCFPPFFSLFYSPVIRAVDEPSCFHHPHFCTSRK